MNQITAEQARKLSQDNLSGPVIGRFVDALSRYVVDAANRGKTSINPWALLSSLRTPSPNHEERAAIVEHFLELGYGFKEFPDPDPGDPRSSDRTEMSWG